MSSSLLKSWKQDCLLRTICGSPFYSPQRTKPLFSWLLVFLWITKGFFPWRVFRFSLLREYCESLELLCLWFEKFQQQDFWTNVSCISVHGPIMGLGLSVLCTRVLQEDCYVFCREEVEECTKTVKILQFLLQALLLPSMSCQQLLVCACVNQTYKAAITVCEFCG